MLDLTLLQCYEKLTNLFHIQYADMPNLAPAKSALSGFWPRLLPKQMYMSRGCVSLLTRIFGTSNSCGQYEIVSVGSVLLGHSMFPSGLFERALSRLLLRLLLLLLLRPPRAPLPPPRPPLGLSLGGGLTKAKSTEIVWSSSFAPLRALIAARASGWVGYSMSA